MTDPKTGDKINDPNKAKEIAQKAMQSFTAMFS
jgi:hypothetical protein